MASDATPTEAQTPLSGIAEGLELTRVQKGEIRELTEQFYVTLRASFSRLRLGVILRIAPPPPSPVAM